jgi:alkanesulfonate monooxygenase SsuD/methylene tetrahydromethanopterin reductase-like flavin-dependent oxidoreductase (luciferase family)
MKVRFAVAPSTDAPERTQIDAFADALEVSGFDGVWLSDVPLAPVLDPLLALALIAGRTSRLRLGANVVPLGRNPYLLAKELAQLDHLCDGRLLLSFVPGLDLPGERAVLGVDGVDRGTELEQVLGLVRRWWDGEAVEHHSARWSFPSIAPATRPVQEPLEVWLGGRGPRARAVMMDCEMPVLDGYRATGEIRAGESDRSHVPIIAMTARALADDRQRCLDAGMDDYLPKPLRETELDAVLERWLGTASEQPSPPGPAASPDAALATALVDEQRLRHFRESYPEVIEPLLRLFAEATPPLIEQLREAAIARDDEQLRRAAHKLKGGCQNVGALELGRLALELEQGGEPEALITRIDAAYGPTHDELQRLLA